ncbi:MAG TPA: NlpC/P60 family protein [Verrucomicrobiota bacterium]|nr:NlpC/P60 family protein [Verrucomicrobiota bacterium]HNU51075.1 NlpC/P60 family protein [Verrucomicrobiota bacterium]
MTRPLINTPEERERLRAIIESWVGTPFHAFAALKGVGVDCVHLGAEIFREAGHIEGYVFPAYAIDAGQHAERSVLLDWLDACPKFERIEQGGEVGDVFCFQFGRCVHHLGVCVGGTRFIHALARRRVRYGQLDDPTYGRRLVATYRPVVEL